MLGASDSVSASEKIKFMFSNAGFSTTLSEAGFQKEHNLKVVINGVNMERL